MNNNIQHLIARLLKAVLIVSLPFQLVTLARANETSGQPLSIETTPESVKALIKKNTPIILINSDKLISKQIEATDDVRRIYYTVGVSKASARKAARQDQQRKLQSQVLVGTPLEWNHLNLPIGEKVTPNSPVLVSPKSLSEAIKDSEDILIIDLRDASNQIEIKNNLFMGNSISLLPHQVKGELKSISKLRWTVLVDNGQGVAENIAGELRAAGYVLVGVLDGGYPAWVADTNK